MKTPLWLLKWILKAAIFFTLFAFALNNQHEASVHFFFGHQWRSPMVLIVLAAFALGMAVGALGMVPWRWRRRSTAHESAPPAVSTTVPSAPTSIEPASSLALGPQHGA